MRKAVLLAAAAALAGCEGPEATLLSASTGGDPERGVAIIKEVGCGSCHTIPGVRNAHGKVAPPLDFFAERTYIAGRAPNTPRNLIIWLENPPAIDPATAMPSVGLSEQQARDVAAYLYTLR